MKMAKHKFGVLPYLGTGVLWIVDTFGTSSAWWAANVQPYADSFWPYAIGFVAGMLLQDVTNPQSWLRESWKEQINKFEVEGLRIGHSVDGPKRLEVNVHIKFLRRLKSADLALRVHSCTGMQYAPHIHPIKVEHLSDVMKDERHIIRLCTLVISHPGWTPYHSTWGSAPLSTTMSAPALIRGSKNVVYVELTGPWMLRQTQKFFVANLDYGSGESTPALYAQNEDEDIFKTS